MKSAIFLLAAAAIISTSRALQCYGCGGGGSNGINCKTQAANEPWCLAKLTGTLVDGVFTTVNVQKQGGNLPNIANKGNGCFVSGYTATIEDPATVICQCNTTDHCVDNFNLYQQNITTNTPTTTCIDSKTNSTCMGNACLMSTSTSTQGVTTTNQQCVIGKVQLYYDLLDSTMGTQCWHEINNENSKVPQGRTCVCYTDKCNTVTLNKDPTSTSGTYWTGQYFQNIKCTGTYGFGRGTAQFQQANDVFGCVNSSMALSVGTQYTNFAGTKLGQTVLCGTTDCNTLKY